MAIVRPEGLCQKISSDTIGNRTRDLPACSAEPQPTAPPRVPIACQEGLRCVEFFVWRKNPEVLLWRKAYRLKIITNDGGNNAYGSNPVTVHKNCELILFHSAAF